MEFLHQLAGKVVPWVPRLTALGWAIFAALTALAYYGVSPAQLEVPSSLLPGGLWVAWAFAAVLLMIGALVPPNASETQRGIARWFRIAGIAVIAALLAMWTDAFISSGDRGWVSGKNYLALLVAAVASAVITGRERGREWEPK